MERSEALECLAYLEAVFRTSFTDATIRAYAVELLPLDVESVQKACQEVARTERFFTLAALMDAVYAVEHPPRHPADYFPALPMGEDEKADYARAAATVIGEWRKKHAEPLRLLEGDGGG